ncbi:MAG: DUF2889 domain-containing protein [Gammaproteobacteria bacterium]|nr:DUF2889 domain-containing protein [Gammaproteobacteria bacterium]
MPLATPQPRRHLHTRTITCEGFLRDDGLWDIEARLVDVKTYPFPNEFRGGSIPPGEPMHDLLLRVTLDLDLVIHAIDASSEHYPYRACSRAPAAMRSLIGLRIGGGFLKRVKERIGVSRGCTHLIEMMSTIATTSYQTMNAFMEEKARAESRREKPHYLDSCIAMRCDGEVVRREWPEFFTGPKP